MPSARSVLKALFVPGLILAFCLVYAYSNRAVPAADMMLVTPVTAILVVLVLIEGARALRAESDAPIDVARLATPVSLLVAVAAFVYAAAYDFLIAGIVFTAVALVLLGERRPPVIAANAALTAPALFFLFDRVIGVPLNSVLWN